MKKLLLALCFICCFILNTKGQTEGWQQMKSLNDDIATRRNSQMVSYNGKLYFFGGYGLGVSSSLNDFWEYDPLTKKLTEQNSLTTIAQNPYDGAAIVVGDKMYFVYSGQLYEYNFLTKVWSQRANFPVTEINRQNLSAVGNVLYLVSSSTNKFYGYDIATNTWLQKANYPGLASSGGISFSIGSKVYKGGGQAGSTYISTFYEYDPATDIWTNKANIPAALVFATGVACNGKGYVGAGYGVISGISRETGAWYEYTPGTNTWANKATGPFVHASAGATIDNTIFLFSGGTATISKNFISRYTPSDDTWKIDSAYAGGNRMFASGHFYNGKIYIAGGDDSEQRIDTWEYTIATNSWARKADMPGTGFSLSGQASVADKLFVIGGMKRGQGLNYSNALLQYDAATNIWETKTSYPGGALSEIGAFSIDGELYAGGGWSGSPGISSNAFYKYNPQTNTWTPLSSAPNNGSINGSFAIGNTGYFIFLGSGTTTGSLYAYNKQTNTWTQKQSVPDFGASGGSQGGTGNVVVKDGYAYLLGMSSGPFNTVKKYDPVADKWTSIFRAPFFKKGFTAVTAGDDIYIGLGYDAVASPIYYHTENDWFKLNFQQDVSTALGDFDFGNSTANLVAGESKTFTDSEGKLFISVQAGPTVSVGVAIKQRSLPASNFREKEIQNPTGTKFSAMFANKNFTSSAVTGVGTKLRMYFTTAELNSFVNAFNTKYGTTKTISDIKIASSIGTPYDLDPLNNDPSAFQIYTPTVNDYKTSYKYLEYTLGANEAFVTEVYAILTIPAQTISFPAFFSKVYGAVDFASGITSTNNTLPITYTSSNTSVATIAADGKIHVVGAGTANITASQAGNAEFSAAAPISRTLTVTPAPVIAKADNKTKIYGTANPAFTITYSGLVNGETAASLTTQPTVTTTATAASPVNTYTLTASGGVSANYTFTYSTGNLTVTPAPLTVTAKNITKVYDGLAVSGGNGVDFVGFATGDNATNSLTGTLAFSGTSQGAKNAGKYGITPSGYAAVNYTFTYVNGELAIDPKPVTVTAEAKSKVYRQADPALTYTSSAPLITGDSFTGALSRAAGENTGTYAIGQNTLSAGSNYSLTFVPANLTITKAALTITAEDKTRVQGAANPVFTASYSGLVNSETSAVLTAQPTFSTTATAASVPGTYPITPSGATALNYDISYINGKLVVAPAPPVISSFTPTTSITGATISITGNYFTGATAVSFGGVPAASFTVVSATSITAVVAAGASGNVSVTTPIGTGTLSGYTFVPKPTITAGGQTTFASGGSVVLSASPGSGYSYKWAKDGVDITGATAASYTATATGSYTVTITANAVSQTSTATAVSSIFVLPANNYKITATGETCKTSNNGSINITATQSKSYTAVLTGNSLNLSKPFTTTVDFSDLQAGTYNVCITLAGESAYKQCFDVVITEPKDLSVYAVVKEGNKISLDLKGSNSYIVELNGSIFKTDKDKLSLDLRPGNNTLKVSTGTICQGVFEKNIQVFDKPLVYPNPFESVLNLASLPSAKTLVEIRSLQGRVVFKQQFNNESGTIALALENLDAGIYVLKTISAESESTYRIIKK